MVADSNANKDLYGRSISAKEIVTGDTPVVPSAKPLVDVLDQVFLTSKYPQSGIANVDIVEPYPGRSPKCQLLRHNQRIAEA